MRKSLVILAAATAGAAGLAVMGPTIAGAIDSPTTTTTPGSTTAGSTAPSTTKAPGVKTPADRSQRLRDILKPLVDKGTITQSQADAVIAALEAATPAKGPGPLGGFGHRGDFHIGASLDTIAKALGMTIDELRTALRSGQSIAQIAQSKNVAIQKVIDALTADAKTALDAAVKAGRLTQAQADQMLTTAKDRLSQFVNGQGGAKAPAIGRRFDGGRGLDGGGRFRPVPRARNGLRFGVERDGRSNGRLTRV
jgi:hypothetical protein